MITEDKVTELFCNADDFCKEFNAEIKKNAVLPSEDGKKTPQPSRKDERCRDHNHHAGLPLQLFPQLQALLLPVCVQDMEPPVSRRPVL